MSDGEQLHGFEKWLIANLCTRNGFYMIFSNLKYVLDSIANENHPYTFINHCPQAGLAFPFCLETERKQRVQARLPTRQGCIKIPKN